MDTKKARLYGYAVLINEFEPNLRNFLSNEVLLIKYGKNWLEGIPEGVIKAAKEKANKEKFENPLDLLDSTDFPHLKEISIHKDNFQDTNKFYGDIPKEKFCELMDFLYEMRNKIAHSDRNFSFLDLQSLIEVIFSLTKGELGKDIQEYVRLEKYTGFEKIPLSFMISKEESKCLSNLPSEDYDLEGGFVGRQEDRKKLIKLLYSDSNQTGIITITGGGGVGKTALALNTAYFIKDDIKNPFDAIIWFSAKKSKLTSEGIVDIEPQIKNFDQLCREILKVIHPNEEKLINALDSEDEIKKYLFEKFALNTCLLIIDNLETIIEDASLVDFIKDIPRPTKVLITSRKGLGEIERRFPLKELSNGEAIRLFRIISRDKNLDGLISFHDDKILQLVNKVQNYPLAIKWSLGQIAMGKDIDKAFNLPLSGKSDIAKFCFEDTFKLLKDNSIKCLYGISLFKDPPSSSLLAYMTELKEEDFELAIRELILTSFIFQITEEGSKPKTKYFMLSLTRDFVENKLDEEKELKHTLQNRLYNLQGLVEQQEKAKTQYIQSTFSLGAKSAEDKIAITKVKAAKNYIKSGNEKQAEILFEEGIRIAPDFPYTLIEYAKFEFERGHYNKSNLLLEKASKSDPKNFHVWYSWGIIKKRQQEIDLAEKYLLVAKSLDPENPSLLNDLGRVYTFKGRFSEANDCFEKALKPVGYVNNRHRLIAFQYISDNFMRWSEQFFLRRDPLPGIQYLEKALEYIEHAITLDLYDRKQYEQLKRICLNLGIRFAYQNKSDEAEKYFKKCIEPIKIGNLKVSTSAEIKARAYYYWAKFSIDKKEFNSEVENRISKGLAIVPIYSDYKEKLENLYERVQQRKNQRLGKITYFNHFRKFGIITSNSNETYLFFPNHFRTRLLEDISSLVEREVSFIPFSNSEQPEKPMATEILLL